jgi:hypothetical protein
VTWQVNAAATARPGKAPEFARGPQDGTDLFRGESALCCLLGGGDGLFDSGDVEAIGMIKGLYFFIVCLSGSLTKLAAHGQTERASYSGRAALLRGPNITAAQQRHPTGIVKQLDKHASLIGPAGFRLAFPHQVCEREIDCSSQAETARV